MPYIIPVLKAHGIPINSNLTAVILGIIALIGYGLSMKLFLLLKKLLLFETSCSSFFYLGIYGFILFPPGMRSFDLNGLTDMRDKVGNYGILALALVLIIQFFTKIGINGAVQLLFGEIFPKKLITKLKHGFLYLVPFYFIQLLVYLGNRLFIVNLFIWHFRAFVFFLFFIFIINSLFNFQPHCNVYNFTRNRA